jgi:pyruvate,water dikinase
VLDPGSIDDLEPGDVMIAPTTDPSWTPLFLAVAGVVSEVGAVASHAAIASRELGIPCAVSVLDATRRIPDGAIVTLDGAAGTVTVVSVP